MDMMDDIDNYIEEEEDFELIEGEELELFDPNELTEAEARELTSAIQSTITATYILLERAHSGKAYKALGYDSWTEYISTEFDFSVQRSYQLLNLAKTAKAIEEVAPDDYELKLTEAQARDIKNKLPEITEAIATETAGLSGPDSSEIIESIIQEAREQKKADEAVFKEEEESKALAEEEALFAELEAEADQILKDGEGLGLNLDTGDSIDSMDSDGGTLSSRDTMSIATFTTMLTSLDTLPSPDKMVSLIPDNQASMIEDNLDSLITWLEQFSTEWRTR